MLRKQSYLTRILRFFSIDREQRSAKRTLEFVKYSKDCKLILVEAWQTPWNQLGLSLFLPNFVKEFGGMPVNYYLTERSILFEIKQKLRHFFSVSRKYGLRKIVFFGPSNMNKNRYEFKARQLILKHNTPHMFEKLTVKDIRIGDLVYDEYLRASKKPTIDFDDALLVRKLANTLCYLDELILYFETNSILAVCVSHTVYSLALPSRVATLFGVKAFQVNGEYIYRMDSQESHAYTDFKTYKSDFDEMPSAQKELGLTLARERIERRLSGEVAIDMLYSTASAYKASSNIELGGRSKIKILIAVHDFFDSPHAMGDNLFPDFLLWLAFLSEIANETEYDWYIKMHPDVVGDGEKILTQFVSKNPKFQLVNNSVSHHSLIQNGINVVLTIFGTISSEYSYLGKLAINASLNNPHINFNFSLSPNDLSEYSDLLRNLPRTLETHKPSRIEVLAFYYMHNIERLKSWTIDDVERAAQDLGGYSKMAGWKIFDYFTLGSNSIDIERINKGIRNFLLDDSRVLKRKHFN